MHRILSRIQMLYAQAHSYHSFSIVLNVIIKLYKTVLCFLAILEGFFFKNW